MVGKLKAQGAQSVVLAVLSVARCLAGDLAGLSELC